MLNSRSNRILLADQCLDVLALNETRLDDNISNEDMYIDSYDLIRFDRSGKGRGVCMYVKKAYSFLERNDLMRENLEASFVEIYKPSSASFVVGTIYRPPSASVDSFSAIEQLVKQIDDENKEFYLLNWRFKCQHAGHFKYNATKNLISIMEQYQLTQTIDTPTRKTIKSSSLLDVCLTATPKKLIHLE